MMWLSRMSRATGNEDSHNIAGDDVILEAACQRRAEHVRAWLRGFGRTVHAPAFDPRRMTRFPTIFLPLAIGYLISYVFRNVNGPLADELIQRFSLDAGSLGFLTSVYFLAFAVCAIPIGAALDGFGPPQVQGCLMTVAAAGALVFACAPATPYLIVGRALMGRF